MKILVYYPSNKQSIAFNSLLPELNKNGHEVLLVTLEPKGKLHQDLEHYGLRTESAYKVIRFRVWFFIYHIYFLIRFCRRNNVDIVFSHLQPNNIISVIAQYFIKSKVIIFRHHFDYILPSEKKSGSTNERIGSEIINKLAKKIVVPCSTVYNGMVQYESVPPSKLSIIPYYYDFSLYSVPEAKEVQKIKEQYSCKLLLLFSSRMVPLKRHSIGLEIVASLIRKNYDIKMLITDEGPEKDKLLTFVSENNLSDHVIFIGYTTKLINYIKACDILVHPSLTDASNSTVKEIGLQEKAVIVCKGVGDFDDYIINGFNGYSVAPESTKDDMEKIIIDLYNDPDQIKHIGQALRKTVLDTFSISRAAINTYEQLLINH